MLGGIWGQFRDLITEGPHGAFELSLDLLLGERIRSSQDFSAATWGSLSNVAWRHPDHGEISYSFRAAGDLVAAIRREGDYMDWYCSSASGVVCPAMKEAMAQHGWMPVEL